MSHTIDDVPSHRNVQWPDGVVEPQTDSGRPTRSAEQILAESKRLAQNAARQAAAAAEAQLAAPVITNDAAFLQHVQAMAGNIVQARPDGAFDVLQTPNSDPNSFLKAAPRPAPQPQGTDEKRLADGRVVQVDEDGMTARIKRPPNPQPEVDPFENLARAPFPAPPPPHVSPPSGAPSASTQPIPRGVGIKTLKAAENRPPEDWSFYKYLGAKPGYRAVILPSNDVFYPSGFSMRDFAWEELWLIAQGIEEQNITPIIDAIGATLALPEGLPSVRDLTLPDFFFLMYLQRLRSYPSTPLTYSYVSKYGNASSFTVTEHTLVVNSLDAPPQLYKDKWESQGISPPRVKDLEALQGVVLSPEDEMLWDRAQWLAGVSIEEKIAHAKLRGIPALEIVRDFKASEFYSYGVDEVYTVRDPLFQPTTYLSNLLSEYEKQKALREALVSVQGASSDDIDVLDVSLISLLQEIESLKKRLAAGEIIEPEEEDVRVTVNALTFFPNI